MKMLLLDNMKQVRMYGNLWGIVSNRKESLVYQIKGNKKDRMKFLLEDMANEVVEGYNGFGGSGEACTSLRAWNPKGGKKGPKKFNSRNCNQELRSQLFWATFFREIKCLGLTFFLQDILLY